MSKSTMIDRISYLREVCTYNLLERFSGKIGEPKNVVEIDESFYKTKKSI